MSKPLTMSYHAHKRLCARFGHRDIVWVRALKDRSLKIPERHARKLWSIRGGLAPIRWKSDYYACSAIVLVVRRNVVVTVLKVAVEELSTLLVWLLLGIWDES